VSESVSLNEKENVITICTGTSCSMNWSKDLITACKKLLGIGPGEITPDGRFRLTTTTCTDHCEEGPCVECPRHANREVWSRNASPFRRLSPPRCVNIPTRPAEPANSQTSASIPAPIGFYPGTFSHAH